MHTLYVQNTWSKSTHTVKIISTVAKNVNILKVVGTQNEIKSNLNTVTVLHHLN